MDGKSYVSSKRASELSHYAQDYIGQLARGGLIDAKRIGGLWYISMMSLEEYKTNPPAVKAPSEEVTRAGEPESFVTFEGKEYISASRASKISNYNQDYIGQLARSGKILARQIGNRWYVDHAALVAHKEEKDALLAAVQSESVGIRPAVEYKQKQRIEKDTLREPELMMYNLEDSDLMPSIEEDLESPIQAQDITNETEVDEIYSIPIRIERQSVKPLQVRPAPELRNYRSRKLSDRTIFYAVLSGGILTIIVLLSFGLKVLNYAPIYAVTSKRAFSAQAVLAGGNKVAQVIGNALEALVSRDLVYKRGQ